MNYIVGVILLYVKGERAAFFCLYHIMQNNAWRELYINGMPKLRNLIIQFEDKLCKEVPEVYSQLVNLSVILMK